MIELDIIETNELPAEWLEGLKAYASVADESQDAILAPLLLRAIYRVQEKADKTILPCKLRLEETEVENGIVRLYQTIKSIDRVTDGEGNEIRWTRANRTLSCGNVDSVVVEYTTQANEGNVNELMPVVYQYAAALYDGQDSQIEYILRQCR